MVSPAWKHSPTSPRLIDMLRIFTSASRARRDVPSAEATSSSDSRENQEMNGTCSWGALTTRPASSSGTSKPPSTLWHSGLVGPAQPARRRVRVDVDDRAAPELLLHPVPERHGQKIVVVPQEDVQQVPLQAEERAELLREDVALADVEPGLGRAVLVVVARLGQHA